MGGLRIKREDREMMINTHEAISASEMAFGYEDSTISRTFCSVNSILDPRQDSSTDTVIGSCDIIINT